MMSTGGRARSSVGDRVLAFMFARRSLGMGTLPQPQTPFGLHLSKFTDADVKDLAGMQNLRMLELTVSPVTGGRSEGFGRDSRTFDRSICPRLASRMPG